LVHVYLNDIFVFSNTLKEHKRHLQLMLDALTKAEFYLECEKCNLYAEKLDCLGHMIDERGVLSYPYFSQSQLRSNLGPPDLSLGIDATLDLVWPSPAP